MELRKVLGLGCIVGFISSSVQAAPPTTVQQAIDQITADSVLLSGWTSDQFKRAIPFNSTAGNVVPSQLKIFGVEVGAEAVITGTQLDIAGLRNLPTQVVNTSDI